MVDLFCKLGLLDYFVKLSQLKNSKVAWNFREVTGYNLTTSIPTYKNATSGRDIVQADVNEINQVLNKYNINTPNRVRHFMAQCHAETDAGFLPIEQFTGDVFEFFSKYEKPGNTLGNTQKGDGAKYRGAGAIQLTGRKEYTRFAAYANDLKILSDGALYVGMKYFGEAAGFFWSKFKPYSGYNGGYVEAFDLNKKCDEGASVETITKIVNGGTNGLQKRKDAYDYYKTAIAF